MRGIRALFLRHGAERTPEGRSLRLLSAWLSPAQRAHFTDEGYFEVVGGNTGTQYRIYPGAGMNVLEVDEKGRPRLGLCLAPCRGAGLPAHAAYRGAFTKFNVSASFAEKVYAFWEPIFKRAGPHVKMLTRVSDPEM